MLKGLIENECAGQNSLIKLGSHFNSANLSEQQQKLHQVHFYFSHLFDSLDLRLQVVYMISLLAYLYVYCYELIIFNIIIVRVIVVVIRLR